MCVHLSVNTFPVRRSSRTRCKISDAAWRTKSTSRNTEGLSSRTLWTLLKRRSGSKRIRCLAASTASAGAENLKGSEGNFKPYRQLLSEQMLKRNIRTQNSSQVVTNGRVKLGNSSKTCADSPSTMVSIVPVKIWSGSGPSKETCFWMEGVQRHSVRSLC